MSKTKGRKGRGHIARPRCKHKVKGLKPSGDVVTRRCKKRARKEGLCRDHAT